MNHLQVWLRTATRGLCKEAVDQVRREIEDHYYSAREASLTQGATPQEAEAQALSSLGDPEPANWRYREVLLTRDEARMLRGVKRDDHFFRCRPGLGLALLLTPAVLLCVAAIAYVLDAPGLTRIMLGAALGVGMLVAVPTFPIYTPARSRIYRLAKWPVVMLAIWIASGPGSFNWLGTVAIGLFVVGWTDWVCASLRRKLPVEQWPKMLYL